MLKLSLKARKAGFNPDQPRDDRGRWVDAGGRLKANLAGAMQSRSARNGGPAESVEGYGV
jgi:hypothetical protein